MLHRNREMNERGTYVSMLSGGLEALGDVSPKGSEPKETWGDKGREGTSKN